ncbi:MAG: GTPase HflX [Lachnospiraceae bacterium]|nr:GTPase HflX [Lachnospiraceae bacterium]
MQTDFSKGRAILAAVNCPHTAQTGDIPRNSHASRTPDELKALAEACLMEVVCIHVQNLPHPDTATYVGSGKVEEIKESLALYEADTVIFEDTLSPVQMRNLSRALEAVILDRTSLILRIFEIRAKTSQAKLQVELAHCQYMLPRLAGMRSNLSRQGGTSGSLSSRGAGEKKLELDRRHLENRITELKRELAAIEKTTLTQRKKRSRSGLPKVALVGYTNAGKSTLLNGLVSRYGQDKQKTVTARDMLFATLETQVRQIRPPEGIPFLLSDTVGFIDKLPHTLVRAFRSTLAEACEADLLLHVIDFSDPDFTDHIRVTKETLTELSASHIPVLYIYNKADLTKEGFLPRQIDNRIYMSALNPEHLLFLLDALRHILQKDHIEADFLIPFTEGGLISYFSKKARILSTEYKEEGTLIRVSGPSRILSQYPQYRLP